ncbi:MAG TPA: phosphatase PAP2 family protein [Thermomicrobiales bacterium]
MLKKKPSNRGLSPRVVYVLAAAAAFAGLVALVRGGRTSRVDRAVTLSLQRQQAPWFSRLMHLVSWPGFPPQSRIIPLAIPASLALLGYPFEALFQLLGWGTSALSGATKFLMRRPRPDLPEILVTKANIGGTSFPSGHVINYIGVYGFLAFLANRYVRPKAVRRAIVGALTSLIALVGPSRIYLGHHWLSDVLASYLLGSSYLLTLTSIYRRLKPGSRVK